MLGLLPKLFVLLLATLPLPVVFRFQLCIAKLKVFFAFLNFVSRTL